MCSIKYYEGDVERQSVEVGLSVAQDKGKIPAGTTFYWNVISKGGSNVGDPVVSTNSGWDTPVVTPSRGSDTVEWKIAATTNIEMDAPLDVCAIFLSWRGKDYGQAGYINGGSELNVQAHGTQFGSGKIRSHQFRLAERRTDLVVDADGNTVREYTQEELDSLVAAHTFLLSSTYNTPQVYWSADGVKPSGAGGTYQASDFVNAKFWAYSSGSIRLPKGVDGDVARSH